MDGKPLKPYTCNTNQPYEIFYVTVLLGAEEQFDPFPKKNSNSQKYLKIPF